MSGTSLGPTQPCQEGYPWSQICGSETGRNGHGVGWVTSRCHVLSGEGAALSHVPCSETHHQAHGHLSSATTGVRIWVLSEPSTQHPEGWSRGTNG